jgi:hypothetical protein
VMNFALRLLPGLNNSEFNFILRLRVKNTLINSCLNVQQ